MASQLGHSWAPRRPRRISRTSDNPGTRYAVPILNTSSQICSTSRCSRFYAWDSYRPHCYWVQYITHEKGVYSRDSAMSPTEPGQHHSCSDTALADRIGAACLAVLHMLRRFTESLKTSFSQ